MDVISQGDVMTAGEVAQLIHTSEASLAQDRYRRVGIPFIKIGRRVRYLRADVEGYLTANRSITGARPFGGAA